MKTPYSQLSAAQKIALLFIALGEKFAADMMHGMNSAEIKQVIHWINEMEEPPSDYIEKSIEEFYQKLRKSKRLESEGGKNYLNLVLNNMENSYQMRAMMDELDEEKAKSTLHILQEAEPNQLGEFLGKYAPHHIAQMITLLEPERAVLIFHELPPNKKEEVIKRLPQALRAKVLEFEELEKTPH